MQDPLYSLAKAVLDEISEPLREFMSSLMGSAGAELGNLFADRVRFWRFKQALKIVEEAQTLLHTRHVGIRAVSIKTLVPILESASLEDDESMQHKWAALLANAADNSYETEIPPAFPEILKQLSSRDASVLDWLYDFELQKIHSNGAFWLGCGVSSDAIESALKLSNADAVLALENLHRLGLCAPPSGAEGEPTYASADFQPSYHQYYLTAIGAAFIKACRIPPIKS